MRRKSHADTPTRAPDRLTYIDLFAGCGGLSLGLQQAGWEGMFAIERSPMAFETLKHNLVDSAPTHFPLWPEWLPKEALSIQQLIGKKYRRKLRALRGQVMLIAGGPPCQGFSHAGRRQKDDHRNKLYRSYMNVVDIVRPAMVLLENVVGITCEFGGKKKKKSRGRPQQAYSERIKQRLAKLGYKTFDEQVLASDFGVPQNRTRFVAVGIDVAQFEHRPMITPFQILGQLRELMLERKGLPTKSHISCSEAIADLAFDPAALVNCPDSLRFKSGCYATATTAYQKLMRGTLTDGAVGDSHRFVNHTPRIVSRFTTILSQCQRGKSISDSFREEHGINKECVVPLDPDTPASTLTSIPDDMIHYSQPRVLTVRESARLQSFPDWFQFKSKYTTGGMRRKVECPRYTQVANAVPPLLAEALGSALIWWTEFTKPGAVERASVTEPVSQLAQQSTG
jgi:DNA (cytosine-5)-methyltransferase 1